MSQKIRRKHNCSTCKYREGKRCRCVDSDYLGEWTGDDMWCYEWEGDRRPEHLPNDLLLGQIAEECAELIHAIEKFRRVGTANPTPVHVEDAWKNIMGEIADVELSTLVFRRRLPDNMDEKIVKTMGEKYERWCRRLND